MLKMAVVESKKSNLHWWTFIDEFTKRSYCGKTFQTMDEAVNYANETIIYNGNAFDLVDINQPRYFIIDSYQAY